MKLNLRVGRGPKARPVPADWAQAIDLALAKGRGAGRDIFREMVAACSDERMTVACLCGAPAGTASLLVSYGGNRFLAARKSRRVLAWLGRQRGIAEVSAGALARERSRRAGC